MFLALCKAKQHILGRHGGLNPNSESDSGKDTAIEKSIELLAKHLQLSADDVDFIKTRPTEPEAEIE